MKSMDYYSPIAAVKQGIVCILSTKDVGFTPNEIDELLKLEVTKEQHSCQEVKHFVDKKIMIVGRRIKEMQRIKKSLQTLSDACCGGDESALHCTILEALSEY